MKIIPKRHSNEEIKKPEVKFDPGLALFDLRTTGLHGVEPMTSVPHQLSQQAQLELEPWLCTSAIYTQYF